MTAKPVPKSLTLSPSTITRRLTLGVLLAHLFIFSLAGLWLYDDYIKRNAHAAELTLTLSHMLEEYLAGRIEKIDITLLAVVAEFQRQAANGGIGEKTINEFIRRHHERLPEVMSLRALDAGGTLKYGTGVNLVHPINNADHEYFILQRDNDRAGLVIAPPVFTRVDKKWAVPLSRRFNMPNGSFGGVVYVNLPIEEIVSVFSTTNIGENGSVTLMDGKLKTITRYPEPDGIAGHIGKSDLPPPPQGFLKARPGGTYTARSLLDNIERTYSYHKVDDYQLYIAVGMSSKDYLAGWREELSKTVAFLALFSLGAISLSWLVARSWKRQIALMRNLEESETRLNTTQQLAKIGGWEYEVETQTTLWTDELYRIHDMEPGEVGPSGQEHIQKSLECYEPDDRPAILAAFDRCTKDGVPYELEFPFTTVKGRKLWIRTAGNPVFANGKVVKVIGYIMDITERKRMEHKLIASQNELLKAQQIAHLGNWDLNLQAGTGTWSDETYRIFGFEPGEFEPTFDKFLKCVHPEDRKIIEEYYPQISSGKLAHVEFDFRIIKPDGEERVLHEKMEVATHENGKPVKVVGVNFDITERKRAEAALVESERKYRSLFTNMRNGFAYCKMIFDENNQPVDWIYLEVNDAFERVIGLKREAVEGKRVTEVFPTIRDFKPDLFEIYGKVALTGEGTEFTINFEISAVWLSISAYCPQPGYFAAVFDDVTDLKKAEMALRESEERHRAIMETANDAIICINQNGKVFMWNPSAERIFGYSEEEMTGRDMHDFIAPHKYREQAHKALSKFLATGEGMALNKVTEITALHRDGSEFPVELSIAAVKMKDGWGASAIIKDITARKEWENKLTETNQKLKRAMDDIERTHSLLVRQEKLAAMGQLSAGVAHELKNPLNIISTSTQLMMMEEGVTDEVAESGKIIMEQVMRAVKIIDNLREFARERKPERKEIGLCPFIEKTLDLVAYEMRGEGIEIAKECPPEPIQIMGDEDQLAQVFLNITNNARDSMNMKKKSYSFEEAEKIGWKARLTVRTRVEDGKAKISFGDNGVGISEEHKRKLFTPFFTTKGETTGTGLGIAIALGIVENHGGTIEFESEEGKGALFTVTIPLAGE